LKKLGYSSVDFRIVQTEVEPFTEELFIVTVPIVPPLPPLSLSPPLPPLPPPTVTNLVLEPPFGV
jgi:hypothetical protein